MVRRLNNFLCQFERSREQSNHLDFARCDLYFKIKLCFVFLVLSISCFSQEDDTKPSKVNNFKEDSSFIAFDKYRESVARAQIVSLKNGGALLVRLKTNANTINRLKTAGSMDLATQVERETRLNNKAIMRAYTNEFKFCPVYFFNSDCSDSVKHKSLAGIFVDSNLVVNPSIVCDATFYLVAEQGNIYDSSLGLVSEAQASKASQTGTPAKEVFMVIKNRFFIQLNKPFPYYQQGYSIKKYADYVKKMNTSFSDFYTKNKTFVIPSEVKQYVY